MKRTAAIFWLIINLVATNVSAQIVGKTHANFTKPLDKLVLVSTFGELRKDHLHSGVDFSGFHRSGLPVYAADSGYVSRIKVSADGYGLALYITHPNGLKTVYAHLQSFNRKIQDYVQQKQYEIKQFEITLYPRPGELPVKKGEIIGYVGNTGRSYAPHLHFEVRDAFLDYPLNPLEYGFKIRDTKPPVIKNLAVYPASDTTLINGQHRKIVFPYPQKPVVNIYGPFYTAIETYDYVDDHQSRKGTYKTALYVDDSLVLEYKFDRFFFQNSRYVNALIDYADYLKTRRKLQRSYIAPNNKLCIYRVRRGNGVFNLPPGKHTITYEVYDFYGNKTAFSFEVNVLERAKTKHFTPKGRLLHYDRSFVMDTMGLRVFIPAYALYDTTYFQFKVLGKNNRLFSLTPVYSVHTPYVPLQKPVTVTFSVNAPGIPPGKLVIVRIDHRGKTEVLPTTVEKTPGQKPTDITATASGFQNPAYYGKTIISAQSKNFGKFYVTFDTVSPSITPLKVRTGKDYVVYRFKLSDNLSGIGKIDTYLDDRWFLYFYDAKYNLLSVKIPLSRLKEAQTLTLQISDNAGNVTVKTINLKR